MLGVVGIAVVLLIFAVNQDRMVHQAPMLATPPMLNSETRESETKVAEEKLVTQHAQETASTLEAEITTATQEAIQRQTVVAVATSTAYAIKSLVTNLKIGNALVNRLPGGELIHVEDNYLETKLVAREIGNFILEAEFENPYSSIQNSWDMGILFRNAGSNDQYRLSIKSDGQWTLNNHTGDPNGSLVETGYIENLNTGASEWNSLVLAAFGDRGHLFINGEYVGVLDLSARMAAGYVQVATGFFSGNEVDGEVTRYRNVRLWEIESFDPAQAATIAAGYSSLSCPQDFETVSLSDHYVKRSYSNAGYFASYKNEAGWPNGFYELSIEKIEDTSKSSVNCYADPEILKCKVSTADPTILTCPEYGFRQQATTNYGDPIQKIWCAFEIQLSEHTCGNLLEYEYTFTFNN